MLALFARAGAAMIPGASRLPVIGGGRESDVSDTVLVLEEVQTDRSRLAAYDRVCSFPLRDRLPATYPHMLAFPLHLRLMTDPAFPFPALGLVHLHNVIRQRRPIQADELLTLRAWATPLEPTHGGGSSRFAPRPARARSWSGKRPRRSSAAGRGAETATVLPGPKSRRSCR
jgi:hypothetical protein